MSQTNNLIPPRPYDSYKDYLKAMGGNAVILAHKLTPEAIIQEISRAGLRGRGGAGFPTGKKWQTVYTHPCKTRYVVCNAAEGEPGSFKDRFLLRKNPYAFLEGLAIAAHVLQPVAVYIGIKASFAPEIIRIKDAVAEFEKAGLFGPSTIHLVEGPEEYLFGEEKALLQFIEDGSALPREAQYPPYEKGLFSSPDCANPALVNNLETFAHVAEIIRRGAATFRKRGNEDTPGTVLFTLCGDIKRPGVYELDAGLTLHRLFSDFGGGGLNGKIKLALSGVSNGVILPEHFDTPADFGHLAAIGSGLGSAGFIVYDESRSVPEITRSLCRFLYVESCNQCTACKQGLGNSWRALDSLFDPEKHDPIALENALQGARSAPQGNRCYLPVEGSLLIPSLITAFPEEFQQRLAKPQLKSQEVGVPLIKDFDEKKGVFLYDMNYHKKNPDWTYSN